MRAQVKLAALTLCAVFAMPLGCHQDNGLDSAQDAKAKRISEIATKSGGDWSKVSEADKQYVKDNFASGNEQQAESIIEHMGHKPTPPTPGGGKPGGGPPAGVPGGASSGG